MFAVSFRNRVCQFNLPYAETDLIQKSMAESRRPYEQSMLSDMVKRAAPNSTFIDIGANIGSHTIWMAAIANVTVHAFEPNNKLNSAIRRTAEINDLAAQVTVHAMGIGRNEAQASISEGKMQNMGGWKLKTGKGDVPVAPLDSLNFPAQISIIKVDVEGMEIDVLTGARETIGRDQPALYCEAKERDEFEALLEEMKGQDYMLVATFNASPTHLFLPRAASRDLSEVEHLRIQEVNQTIRYRDEIKALRKKIRQT